MLGFTLSLHEHALLFHQALLVQRMVLAVSCHYSLLHICILGFIFAKHFPHASSFLGFLAHSSPSLRDSSLAMHRSRWYCSCPSVVEAEILAPGAQGQMLTASFLVVSVLCVCSECNPYGLVLSDPVDQTMRPPSQLLENDDRGINIRKESWQEEGTTSLKWECIILRRERREG